MFFRVSLLTRGWIWQSKTRTQYLREAERDAEVKLLRKEMFKGGYHWDRWASFLTYTYFGYLHIRIFTITLVTVHIKYLDITGIGGRYLPPKQMIALLYVLPQI